ncbi:hypothetical protein DFJ69_0945 [Thermomonospora umbrina]|uniref:Uncharacterized protein n=1 Tax=Thermomonospora umbrina TaxID=111806 RepID=A0A3D9SRH5_9ACTN|nr:hypothetical protein DFJ69_0945 [Thermomonospora umbrina]
MDGRSRGDKGFGRTATTEKFDSDYRYEVGIASMRKDYSVSSVVGPSWTGTGGAAVSDDAEVVRMVARGGGLVRGPGLSGNVAEAPVCGRRLRHSGTVGRAVRPADCPDVGCRFRER